MPGRLGAAHLLADGLRFPSSTSVAVQAAVAANDHSIFFFHGFGARSATKPPHSGTPRVVGVHSHGIARQPGSPSESVMDEAALRPSMWPKPENAVATA